MELTLNGFGLGLGSVQAAKRVHGVDAAPGSPAMVVVVWTVDLDKAFAQLVSAGTPVVRPPHNTGQQQPQCTAARPRWKPRRGRLEGDLIRERLADGRNRNPRLYTSASYADAALTL